MPSQLLNRHWIITDGRGEVQEVAGPGVVGQQPRLSSGEQFTYTSGAVLKTPVGTMEGSYQFCIDSGELFDVPTRIFLARSQHGALNRWRFRIRRYPGCWRELRHMKKLNFKDSDELWLAGDLVNRGPDSLKVLQTA